MTTEKQKAAEKYVEWAYEAYEPGNDDHERTKRDYLAGWNERDKEVAELEAEYHAQCNNVNALQFRLGKAEADKEVAEESGYARGFKDGLANAIGQQSDWSDKHPTEEAKQK